MIKKILNNIRNKNKICIITGKNVYKNPKVLNLIKLISNKKSKIFFKFKSYPEYKEIIRLKKRIEIYNPDILISVGGGSVLDCSKIIFENIKCKKLLVIPTTAGSGAEATKFAVLYKNKNKHSVKIRKKFIYYLLPELTLDVPKSIKSSSSFDALAQCMESVLSKGSNKLSISYSLKGIKLLLNNIISYNKKSNYKNSKNMLLASNFSGKAINISKTTAPHALSYPFTFYYGISHGYAVSLFFEKILKYSYYKISKTKNNQNEIKKFLIIFKAFKVKNIEELCKKIKIIKKKLNLNLNVIYNIDFDNKHNKLKIMSMINNNRLNNHIVKISKIELFKLIK